MELLIKLLGIAALGSILQDLPPYKWLIQKFKLPEKPFACTLCATFWLSAGPLVAIYGYKGVLYAAFSAAASELLDRQLWKI